MTSGPKRSTSARKRDQWNSPDVDKGNLAVWHEQYLIPHTVVFDKVEVRETSKIIWMGSANRHWDDMKHIKSVKSLHLSTENTEKQSMIYKKARIYKAKVHRDELEKLNDVCDAWGD